MLKRKLMLTTLAAAVSGFAATGSFAAEDNAPEIDRGQDQLSDLLRDRPIDRDSTDTAIIASNASGRGALVVCTAFNANGRRLGAGAMRVPAHGLRFLRAQDLANGEDYIGRVNCHTGNPGVDGSAVLVGPGGLTDLPVRSRLADGRKHFSAPVTASF